MPISWTIDRDKCMLAVVVMAAANRPTKVFHDVRGARRWLEARLA